MPTVFITGASRGIGREFARQYAADGWRTIGTVRDAAAQSALKAVNPKIEAISADVADPPSLARAAKALNGAPIDLLICNAGLSGQADAFGKTDYAAWEHVHRVNVMGPWATVEALIDNVLKSDLKRIVVVSSGAGSIARMKLPPPGAPVHDIYRASKSAANSLMRAFSQKFAGRGATVIAINPGPTKSDLNTSPTARPVEESVALMCKVIAGLTPAQNGRYCERDGVEIPW